MILLSIKQEIANCRFKNAYFSMIKIALPFLLEEIVVCLLLFTDSAKSNNESMWWVYLAENINKRLLFSYKIKKIFKEAI